jgi:hypothetical protein
MAMNGLFLSFLNFLSHFIFYFNKYLNLIWNNYKKCLFYNMLNVLNHVQLDTTLWYIKIGETYFGSVEKAIIFKL